ncbi:MULTISPECIES: TadE/TadG family type IV pilus assembly protein [Limnobacter]|uniref:TadE/TadG family type IV pilus assembly protein n=1 Tax=Limnobacter TaxID=131079 RepID=UPI0024E13F24|nr:MULTISPECIES: TadE/TadG family type IV pilus assembly protein [Limnobacter]
MYPIRNLTFSRKLLFRNLRRQSGANLIEFAFVLPVVLLVVFGVVGFSIVFVVQHSLSSAVSQGARVVAVAGSTGDAESAARQILQSSLPSALYPSGFTFQGPTITSASSCSASLASGSNPTLACMKFQGFFTPANNPFLASFPLINKLLPTQLTASTVVLYQTSSSL